MLLERGVELAVVRSALRSAAAGCSSQLLLTGPLGIGRSALLRELPACADGAEVHVLRAAAAPMEQDLAFGVVRQLFDGVLTGAAAGTRARRLATAGAAGRLLSDDGPAGGDIPPTEVMRGLRALLAELSAEAPLLILIDDLQWADVRSLRWLAHLAPRLDGLRVLLVCTLRDGDQASWDPLVREVADASVQVLRPAPLSLAATGELILEQLGEASEPEFARACHETSLGNPLFLTSVLLGLLVLGHRPVAEHADAARSLRPSQLRDRLTGCLRTQQQPVRDLAAAIATLAEQGDTALVSRLAGLDAVGCAAALRVLHQLGLLADPDEATFVHRVVRDAVESSLTTAERQRWHEAAAAVLYENGRPAEQVAAQLMAVATFGHPWSIPVLRSAADTALRRGAPDQAARYLRRALLEIGEHGPDRARLLIELATVERWFDQEAGERHIAQAVPLLADARDRAAAVLQLAPNFLRSTSPSALDLLRRAAAELGAAQTLDGSAREAALRLEARLRHAGCEDQAQLADSIRKLRVEEPALCSRGERELLAVLLHAATLGAGRPAAELAHEAERILEREPTTVSSPDSVVPLLLVTLVAADSLRPAESWLSAEEDSRARSGTAAGPLGHTGQALLHLARGRLAPAREQAEAAFELAGAGGREAEATEIAVLAAVALATRDGALSARVLAEADRRGPSGLAAAAMLDLLRSVWQAEQGEPELALDAALASGRQLESAGWRNPVLFPWRPWAVSLCRRLGDVHAGRALAEEEYQCSAAWGAPAALGRALRLRAALAAGGESEALLRQAVEVLRASGSSLELVRAVRDLGRLPGMGPEGAALLREAAGLAAGCGLRWSAAGVGPARPRSPGPTPSAVLTPAEKRVGALVRSGLTNSEIAAELRVSARAVEKHLTNSYRKLGIAGRRELVTLLTGTGPAGHR
ncbi:AAA family ATPase [Kitasatospora sp. NPDC049258]|uniref:ATP-binding protein n=1 Tax=Kitasatospora sp. NPDC049258 TaxID=3155394 RepID=UPI0034157C41